MPFQVTEGVIALSGACTIEEAEELYEAVRGVPEPSFDLSGSGYLHTAIVQVIMASGGAIVARPPEADAVIDACFAAPRPA